MPRQIREIKYHPAVDLNKPSIILKSAYINILQNMKKAIRKSNLTWSAKELAKTVHSCQIKLDNTLKGLRKEPNVVKKDKELVQAINALFQQCRTLLAFTKFRSFEKQVDSLLEEFRRMRQPSPTTFFELIQLANDLLQSQDSLYQSSTATRKAYRSLQKTFNSAKRRRHTPLTDSLDGLLPSLKVFIDEMAKFSKLTKPSTHLKAILRNADKLKYISGQYEKRKI